MKFDMTSEVLLNRNQKSFNKENIKMVTAASNM